MLRPFSIIRRRPNLVDVTIPVQAGVDGYTLEKAANFDAVYAMLVTASFSGFVDDTLRDQAHTVINGRFVRIIFDPAQHGLVDTAPFWMRFVPVVSGVPGTPSAGSLILPDGDRYRACIIAGTAPAALDVAHALRIDFPYMVEDLRIRHLAASPTVLYVATEEGGAEFQVQASTDLVALRAATPFILVRGSGGAVRFEALFTAAYPR